jgi:hypothetical protein
VCFAEVQLSGWQSTSSVSAPPASVKVTDGQAAVSDSLALFLQVVDQLNLNLLD